MNSEKTCAAKNQYLHNFMFPFLAADILVKVIIAAVNRQLLSDIPQKSAFQRVSIYVVFFPIHKDKDFLLQPPHIQRLPFDFKRKSTAAVPVFQKLRLQPDSGMVRLFCRFDAVQVF